jgi:hypothetical protein
MPNQLPNPLNRNLPSSAIAPTWTDRNDAPRHRGRRRTGTISTTTFKSAITGAIRRGLLEYEGTMIRKSRT